MLLTLLHQCLGSAHIVRIIFQRVFHGFRYDNVTREMDNCLYRFTGKNCVNNCGVARIALNKVRAFGDRPTMTGIKIIENRDGETGLAKQARRVRADIAGTPGNKNLRFILVCGLRHDFSVLGLSSALIQVSDSALTRER